MSLQAILRYQEVDAKLFKLEREFASSDERKEYVKVKKFLETAPEKLEAYENKATALTAEAENIIKKCATLEATLVDFENVDELVNGGADVAFYKKKAQSVLEQLKKLKAELNALTTAIKETDAEYKKFKKTVLSVEKQAPEVVKKYKEAKTAFDNGNKELEKEIATLGAEVDSALLEKYKTKRKEKIFPVVGELYGGRCPFCSMEPPIAAKSKLANGIECDNCHRIIFEK